ncbi:hypothetical protein Tsubulata_009372 [Turnera subulata]|uniref:EF-hand domain-containing protein n=1 Tax=Turnera subulata TaxID=218843 RepID=A0A9Q0JFT0_9ROSI|nr:hypothetical protein Tsubulata_009372 [Turnera subulata]
MWRIWGKTNSSKAEAPVRKQCIRRNVDEKPPQEVEIMTQKSVPEKTCSDQNLEEEELTIAEVTAVMSKLGTLYDPEGDIKFQERLTTKDIASLFEEQEPSLQELKDAFGIFDENKDGFIDAKELRKVVCTLCLTEASDADCNRMIRAYDDNGDGLIDFNEFVRLVAKSFS